MPEAGEVNRPARAGCAAAEGPRPETRDDEPRTTASSAGERKDFMILSFHPCLIADRQIIMGSRRTLDSEDRFLMAQAEAILLPVTCREDLYRACRASGARVFPCYDTRYSYAGKSGQVRLFREHDLPHPETFTWPSVGAFRSALLEGEVLPHKTPFLVKTDMDHEGTGIYVVQTAEDLAPALAALEQRLGEEGGPVLSQTLIPAGGDALRAVIVGREIHTYWKRVSGSANVLATVSGGATIDFEWRRDLQEKGRRVAERLRDDLGINVAAADMVFPMDRPDPNPRLLEINYAFGRRGLGGSQAFYRMLFEAAREWLAEEGLDSDRLRLI